MRFNTFARLLIALLLLSGCNKDQSIDEVAYNHRSAVGTSAADIVSGGHYKTLLIEFQYMSGAKPTTETIDQLTEMVVEVVDKPNGIRVVQTGIQPTSQTAYSLSELRGIEDSYRTQFTSGDTMAIYFLFVDGQYNSGGANTVLGIAHRNTSMVVFRGAIDEYSGGFGQPSLELLETSVTNHEFGHILGLVANHIDMVTPHQDSQNGHHCDNEDCLMYWAVETGDFVSNLVGMSAAPGLDKNCLDDIEALRN